MNWDTLDFTKHVFEKGDVTTYYKIFEQLPKDDWEKVLEAAKKRKRISYPINGFKNVSSFWITTSENRDILFATGYKVNDLPRYGENATLLVLAFDSEEASKNSYIDLEKRQYSKELREILKFTPH